jgi:hypothetical protein
MGHEDEPYNPQEPSARVLSTQIIIASALGVMALFSFCVLRFKWPKLYAARRARRKGLPQLANSLFGWMLSLYNISEDEILEHAGLDAFVFLGFFKTAIKLLFICSVCGVTIISPIRLYYTGKYDQDDDKFVGQLWKRYLGYVGDDGVSDHEPEDFMNYLWVYVIFTYIFTMLTAYLVLKQTNKVVRIRQEYLGRQSSITDRTIRLSGIPRDMRTDTALKEHIESLGIGTVRSIKICRNWANLDRLFDERDKVIQKLERAWCEYLGPTWSKSPENGLSLINTESSQPSEISLDEAEETAGLLTSSTGAVQLGSSRRSYSRPKEKLGLFGWFGKEVDVIDRYTYRLEILDEEIRTIRLEEEFEALGTAFVTMDSVASAQMAAQAVLDPRPHKILADTAPAPHDVIWRNLYMSTKERFIRTYSITLIIAILSIAMVVPVTSVASFLRIESIRKVWPELADLLERSPWASTLVTGILPPFLFTLLNFLMPYVYVYLSYAQGSVSHGEVELSVISKNFFYVFFNMFVVFTVASSYWSFLKDTTKLAYELAEKLREFSLFYVDLIILQGIGMYPFRLLQFGSVLRFPLFVIHCKSPRDYRELYKPAIFNYGIHLPQPILILIIVLLYSVISTKILTFGTLYFLFGYFTYKYQLMYSMVHPQHSTGRAWPLIVRRICFGLVLFHLAMAGILALQKAYILSTMLAPLPLAIFIYWYNFEHSYVPLLYFIALRAIETMPEDGSAIEDANAEDDEDEEEDVSFSADRVVSRVRSQSRTLDEQRERNLTYINPNMTCPLDGPWIGVDGDDVILANSEGTRRRRMRLEEWE